MARVKICGITNKDDAFKAIKFGADALGFVFYKKSPRFISPSRARNIISILPPFISTVGVFVNEKSGAIGDIAGFCGLTHVQLHGDEDPAFCRRMERYRVRPIKAFRISDTFDFGLIRKYEGISLLFDAWKEGVPGGTGETFNWDILRQADIRGSWILSGGLTPDNVSQAVGQLNPYAVDVSSGVESAAGIKDHHKMQSFILNAGHK